MLQAIDEVSTFVWYFNLFSSDRICCCMNKCSILKKFKINLFTFISFLSYLQMAIKHEKSILITNDIERIVVK